MKRIILSLVSSISVLTFAQIRYEKANFVKNNGEKVECLIKNFDWKNNPTSFEYKINDADTPKVTGIKDVSSFEIYGQSKFLKSNVKIDKSSKNLNQLSSKKEPEYVEEELFLKEIASGNISLFQYANNGGTYYFYQDESKNIEPLVNKMYETSDSNVAYNTDYKNQLQNKLKCTTITNKDYDLLEYNEQSLSKIFTKYYHCSTPSYVEEKKTKKKGKFNLYLQPSLNISSAKLSIPLSESTANMSTKLSFGFGLGAEYVLPFNKNKWAIIAEPNYQSYRSQVTSDVNYLIGNQLITELKFSSIELPIGIRHYMYFSSSSKLFVNVEYVVDIKIDTYYELRTKDGSVYQKLDVFTHSDVAFGVGYRFKNKYGIEAKLYTGRGLTNYYNWNSKYQKFSLILSYNLF